MTSLTSSSEICPKAKRRCGETRALNDVRGAFPRAGAATYGSGNVGDMPGNDFLVVALSFITGKDYRPYFTSRGVQFSALANAQVGAHVTSGKVQGAASTALYALDEALPQANLTQGLQTVALDGAAVWPVNGWSPAQCP